VSVIFCAGSYYDLWTSGRSRPKPIIARRFRKWRSLERLVWHARGRSEAEHYPIPAPDPIAAIEFMMEQESLSRRLAAAGACPKFSPANARPLTLPMVREMSTLLQILTDVLVQPHQTRAAA